MTDESMQDFKSPIKPMNSPNNTKRKKLMKIKVDSKNIVVKYSLQYMFDDPPDAEYKVESKLDFCFHSSEPRLGE